MVRAVDDYVLQPWGRYLARPTPGREQFHYLESWLLPALGLRATVFHVNPGHERGHDYYLDVGEYTPGADVWHSHDHYLDIEVRTGTGAELADVELRRVLACIQILGAQEVGPGGPKTWLGVGGGGGHRRER